MRHRTPDGGVIQESRKFFRVASLVSMAVALLLAVGATWTACSGGNPAKKVEYTWCWDNLPAETGWCRQAEVVVENEETSHFIVKSEPSGYDLVFRWDKTNELYGSWIVTRRSEEGGRWLWRSQDPNQPDRLVGSYDNPHGEWRYMTLTRN